MPVNDAGTEGETFVLLDEYNLADAVRVTGFTEPAIKTWMVNGALSEGEWRRVEDANGAGRAGYLFRRDALEREATRRGRACQWGQARGGRATEQVARVIRDLRARVAALEAQLGRADVRAEVRAAAVPAHPRIAAIPASALGLPETGPIPDALRPVSAIARAHGFDVRTETIWRKAMMAGAFRVVSGDWSRGGRRAHHALDAAGVRSFLEWACEGSKHYRQCRASGCPCADYPPRTSPASLGAAEIDDGATRPPLPRVLVATTPLARA